MASFTSSVSPKGQVTIPVEIRQRFHIETRDTVSFEVVDDVIVVRPVTSPVDTLYRSVPALEHPMSWNEIEETIENEIARNVYDEDSESD